MHTCPINIFGYKINRSIIFNVTSLLGSARRTEKGINTEPTDLTVALRMADDLVTMLKQKKKKYINGKRKNSLICTYNTYSSPQTGLFLSAAGGVV